jgi:hypothetical protein
MVVEINQVKGVLRDFLVQDFQVIAKEQGAIVNLHTGNKQ